MNDQTANPITNERFPISSAPPSHPSHQQQQGLPPPIPLPQAFVGMGGGGQPFPGPGTGPQQPAYNPDPFPPIPNFAPPIQPLSTTWVPPSNNTLNALPGGTGTGPTASGGGGRFGDVGPLRVGQVQGNYGYGELEGQSTYGQANLAVSSGTFGGHGMMSGTGLLPNPYDLPTPKAEMPGSSYGFNPPQSLQAPMNPPPLSTTGPPNPFQTQPPLHTYAQNHGHQHHHGHRPHPGPIQLPPPMPLQLSPYPLPPTGVTTASTNNGGSAAVAQVGQAFNQLGPGSREGTSTATGSREYSRSVTSTPSPPPMTSAPRGVGVGEGREIYAAGMHSGYGHSRSTSGSLSLTSAASPDYPPIPLSHTSSHSHSHSGSQTRTPSLQKHPSNTKRAAQNRAAQKAFRVRREKYVRDLESKASEFEVLKERVRELEEENRRLRGERS
ncbi:hypothetical protein SAICODRAFT_23124 [Saitoella complicata NRRL Y-17804]|nr:uncharacterized protein SAICODRAFT_23124 [Saitoella complicata NRRL Y-17804]ODQ55752.1 hypothetical protein SAICODRAFT_23124 [Saitoella complicata NRRL Y-17804]